MSRHTKIITRSFAGGEMSPEMFGRMDDVKFQAGAATLLNCIPRPAGATARRSGTRLVREIGDSSKLAHLLPFVFSSTQSMAVEMSRSTSGGLEGGYFRFHTTAGRSSTRSRTGGLVPNSRGSKRLVLPPVQEPTRW